MDLSNMNDQQLEAIKTTNGPILIIAGAGSGKTKVLTNKVAYLIEEKNVNPYNILAITFTNKAAKEMKDRIYNLIGNKTRLATISTFHSFGLLLLKENYKVLGYTSNPTIIDSDDSLTVIKKILKEKNLDPKFYNPKNIKNKISSSKNEMIDHDEYQKMCYTNEEKVIGQIYKKYDELLYKNNSVDFDDLLLLPITLFKEHKDILEIYQEKYKYILIDEYQDTNEVQYILTKLLASKYKNICVVGDSDQSIYSFRGANYKNILNFEKDYKDAKVITLETNYRSSSEILTVANNVIKNNKMRPDKKLISYRGSFESVKYFKCLDDKNEGKRIIDEIKKLKESGINYQDIAIIYRTNAQSRSLEEQVLKANIPYKIIGSYYFYNRKEIKDLISYLRLINNPSDDISLTRIINVPKRKIGDKTVENLSSQALIQNKSMFETIEDKKCLEFKDLINNLIEKSKTLTLTELITAILEDSGMKQELVNEKTLEADIRLENLEEFKSITKEYEEINPTNKLNDFLNEISLVSDVSEYDDVTDKLSLLTIHSVKGLEYKVVFVCGLEEGLFPHVNSFGNDNEIEEERRLMYVALTRAKEKLYVTNAIRRMLFGDIKINLPSRFIDEMQEIELVEDALIDKSDKMCYNDINKRNLKEANYYEQLDTEYNVSDKVKHEEFGTGVVVKVDKMILTIAFKNPIGIKMIMKNHKYLSRLDN